MKWKKHDISALYCCKSCHKVMVQNEFTCILFAHLCLALTERQNLCKSLCNSVSVWAGVCIEGFCIRDFDSLSNCQYRRMYFWSSHLTTTLSHHNNKLNKIDF